MRRGAVTVVLLALLATGCGAPADEPATVRVAAASDLRYAFDDVVDGFTGIHPEIRVEVSYGSSGVLYQQVGNGAPFDLYLAADVAYADRLVDEGVAAPAEVFRYAEGRLVVWAGAGSPVDPTAGIGAVRDAGRVAIANPAHAPYGRAAEAALRAAGRWEEVADRLVLGESVAQAAEFVAAGNAEVGIVARSQVLAPPLRDVGVWRDVPTDLYDPLDQGGVVLGGEPARMLRDHLTGPAGQEVLRRYGFEPPR